MHLREDLARHLPITIFLFQFFLSEAALAWRKISKGGKERKLGREIYWTIVYLLFSSFFSTVPFVCVSDQDSGNWDIHNSLVRWTCLRSHAIYRYNLILVERECEYEHEHEHDHWMHCTPRISSCDYPGVDSIDCFLLVHMFDYLAYHSSVRASIMDI